SSITGFATHKSKDRKNNEFSPLIQTRDIKRYYLDWTGEYIENKIYSNKLQELFKQKKIVIARVTKSIQATIDEEKNYVGKSSILIPKNKELFEILLAIINSKLIDFYYRAKFETTHMAGGYIRFDIPYLKQLPVRLPNEKQTKNIIELVNRMRKASKEKQEQQIQNIDYELNEEIYEIYQISTEEKKVIEES
ncbi:hypothetical protein J4403_00850, partial [Candidatus Woesearchaeota archaeon]|nr:hypothetical protein [Candidatus Woesearchaeota archaeon]